MRVASLAAIAACVLQPGGPQPAPKEGPRDAAAPAATVSTTIAGAARVLHVGPGQAYSRPEAALADAREGDVIEFVPAADAAELVVPQAALLVRTSRVTIRGPGLEQGGAPSVVLDGAGFEYSGAGRTPRAIIQVDPGADGVVIEGLAIRNAHNETGNGAGVRINAASSVTIRNCTISGCDMGVMSNGASGEARAQRLEHCEIFENGSAKADGLSHNLYLGGEDVTLVDCSIYSSTNGHNLKSRARLLTAEHCRIRNAAHREIDLVDSPLTEEAGADAKFIGCTIAKRRDSTGNRTVIHFGRDGTLDRKGTLTLDACTITTYYASPVIDLSTRDTRCELRGCTINNEIQRGPVELVRCAASSELRVTGSGNVLAACYAGVTDLLK